jgi:hypothetical protein
VGEVSRALPIAALTGVAIIVWVLYLYRKGRLKEDYAILWLSVSVVIVVLSVWTDLLLAVNWFVGAEKVSDVVLAAFVAFLLVICIYYSVRLSELAEQNKKMAQEIVVMKASREASNADLKGSAKREE